MKGVKTVYNCTECGYETPKWFGKCPSCGAWNSAVEDVVDTTPASSVKNTASRYSALSPAENSAIPYSELELPAYMRISTGVGELNRALGGGLVNGSVVLLCGEPGIGKSTLLMQICNALGQENKVLYVSGEESRGQLKLRAKRLKLSGNNLYILTDTNVNNISSQIDKIKPDIVIIDSVQTMYSDAINSAPGSVSQVRETALSFISIAKSKGISFLMVGHVNKEGSIAGPKVLEHMVDAVMYFEGERRQSYRIIRAVKNRFGSTNEIGVFEMTENGLEEVENPSEMLLSGRPLGVSGNCTVCVMEGTRPIIAEIQALVTPTSFPAPRRTATGLDYNRMCLVLAVLEKRLGLRFSSSDAYMNIVGGLHIDEPAADLATALALVSSIKDIPVPQNVLAIGEIGLSGECRAVSFIEQRVKEAARLGFNRVIIPDKNADKLKKLAHDIDIIPAKSIFEAIQIFSRQNNDK